jgi:co-chaperonin GroES (HSP10)
MGQAQLASTSAQAAEDDITFDATQALELRRRGQTGGVRLYMLGQRVLVKRLKEEKSPGGIILAEDSKAHATMGEAIAVGDGCTVLKVGDIVLFGRFSGDPVAPSTTLDLSDELRDVVVMMEEDVMGLFRPLPE